MRLADLVLRAPIAPAAEPPSSTQSFSSSSPGLPVPSRMTRLTLPSRGGARTSSVDFLRPLYCAASAAFRSAPPARWSISRARLPSATSSPASTTTVGSRSAESGWKTISGRLVMRSGSQVGCVRGLSRRDVMRRAECNRSARRPCRRAGTQAMHQRQGSPKPWSPRANPRARRWQASQGRRRHQAAVFTAAVLPLFAESRRSPLLGCITGAPKGPSHWGEAEFPPR